MSNIEETLKGVISKSAEVSKDVFTKAGGAVQNFSDKSVLKFEIKQLKEKRKNLYTDLGQRMSELLLTKGFNFEDTAASTSKSDEITAGIESISELQDKINDISALIKEKEASLKIKNEKK
mgnify:CR=1 FL=1